MGETMRGRFTLRAAGEVGQALLWTIGLVAGLGVVSVGALSVVTRQEQSAVLREAIEEDVVVARAVALTTEAGGAVATTTLPLPTGSDAPLFSDVVYCSSLNGTWRSSTVNVTVTTTTPDGSETLNVTASPGYDSDQYTLSGWDQTVGGSQCPPPPPNVSILGNSQAPVYVNPGSTLDVGYILQMPSSHHPWAQVTASDISISVTASCYWGGSHTFTITLPDGQYTVQSGVTSWTPTGYGGQTEWQLTESAPDVCSGSGYSLSPAPTFTALVASTDTQDTVNMEFEVGDGRYGAWSGTASFTPDPS